MKEQTSASAAPGAGEARFETGETLDGGITLTSSCTCGHPRRTHAGRRMESRGACLECDCCEFDLRDDDDGGGTGAVGGGGTGELESDEAMIARIRAAIEKVERLIAVAETVSAEPEE